MADDYDNTEDIGNMTDDELKGYVLAQLASQKTIDATDVTVRVSGGAICLDGRVGTEEELRIIDHVVTDLTGLQDIDNQIVVDELRRAESPEPMDEHLADEIEHSGLDRKSTRLNSSHSQISYAVFCLKKKKKKKKKKTTKDK